MPDNRRKVGAGYEKIASGYLVSLGYDILCMNFRSRCGEIDIIGMDKDVLCFIEVKYRKDLSTGFPGEAVTAAKQRKIIRTSEYFMLSKGLSRVNRRYDVIEILGDRIRLSKNSFGGF